MLSTHIKFYGGPKDGEHAHWDLMLDQPVPALYFVDDQAIAAHVRLLIRGEVTEPEPTPPPIVYAQSGPVVLSRLSGMAWAELELPPPIPLPGEGRTIILEATYRHQH